MRSVFICFAGLFAGAYAWAAVQTPPCCAPSPTSSDDPNTTPLEYILNRLQKNAAELTACTANIEYLFIENPDLLDAHSLRKGRLYYAKSDGRSRVRIDFDTLKQDDFDEEKRPEVYLFDGVWLTKIDYTLEQVDLYQQAPEDEPIDALDFISHRFPLVGFSGSKQFESEFDICLVEAEVDDDPNLIHLVLTVRQESRYSKDYKKIDFWINKNLYMPHRVCALSTQDDIYDIRFFDIKTNKKIEKRTFTVETPVHFRKNIEPLKQEPQ